jgi:hypothetical protein
MPDSMQSMRVRASGLSFLENATHYFANKALFSLQIKFAWLPRPPHTHALHAGHAGGGDDRKNIGFLIEVTIGDFTGNAYP